MDTVTVFLDPCHDQSFPPEGEDLFTKLPSDVIRKIFSVPQLTRLDRARIAATCREFERCVVRRRWAYECTSTTVPFARTQFATYAFAWSPNGRTCAMITHYTGS